MSIPTNQTLQRRRSGIIPYVAGGRQTVELDRDGAILKAVLDLSYTVTNGATDPATPLHNWPARLIRRVEVIVGGRDTIWSVSGEELAERLLLEHQGILPGISQSVTSGNAATTAVRLYLPLEFTLPGGRRIDDTGLDTRGVGTITLSITWATSTADLFTTPNSAAISGVTLNLETIHLRNLRPDQVFLVRALDSVERAVTGSTDNFDLTMDRGTGLVYRSFMLRTLNDNVAANTVLDSGVLRLECGAYVFQNRTGYVIRAENQFDQVLQSMRTGSYFIDLLLDGQLSNGINTAALDSDLKFMLGVTKSAGVCNVVCSREAVRPLKLG